MPSRHSFFGFAGPVDWARGDLTRQRVPLFPVSTQKGAARGRMQKKSPAHWGLRGAKLRATRGCDSHAATRLGNAMIYSAAQQQKKSGPEAKKVAEAAPTAC